MNMDNQTKSVNLLMTLQHQKQSFNMKWVGVAYRRSRTPTTISPAPPPPPPPPSKTNTLITVRTLIPNDEK